MHDDAGIDFTLSSGWALRGGCIRNFIPGVYYRRDASLLLLLACEESLLLSAGRLLAHGFMIRSGFRAFAGFALRISILESAPNRSAAPCAALHFLLTWR